MNLIFIVAATALGLLMIIPVSVIYVAGLVFSQRMRDELFLEEIQLMESKD